MRRAALCAVLVLGTLGACGGDDDDGGDGADADSPAAGSRGGTGATYEGELQDGSRLHVRLDVDPGDAAVAPFEELRVQTGATDVTWIVAAIDVPDGVDGTGRFLTFVAEGADPLDDDPTDDADGVTNAEFACALLDDWVSGSDDLAAANEAYLALLEGPCGGQTLQVLAPGGETTTYVMAYEGALPDFERIYAGLGTELQAT